MLGNAIRRPRIPHGKESKASLKPIERVYRDVVDTMRNPSLKQSKFVVTIPMTTVDIRWCASYTGRTKPGKLTTRPYYGESSNRKIVSF